MPKRILVPVLVCLLVATARAYDVAPMPFAWTDFPRTPVALGDDELSPAVPLPFSFNFLYGYPYFVPLAAVRISSNGFITFAQGQSDGCTGQPAPCSGQQLPGGPPGALIAGYWEDLDPAAGGHISYGTIGTAPTRTFIVEFSDVPHAPSGHPASFQIKLFESTNEIQIHCKSCPSDGGRHTQGLEGVPAPDGSTNAVCYTTNRYLQGAARYSGICRRRGCAGGTMDNNDCKAAADCPGGVCTTFVAERNAADFSLTNDALRFTPPNNRVGIAAIAYGPSAITGLRYRFRVDANDGAGGGLPEFKLFTEGTGLFHGPGVITDTYLINTFFFTDGFRYSDPLCGVTYGFPADVAPRVPGASFWLQIPDYVRKGLTGARTDQPVSLPRQSSTGAIDGSTPAITLEPQLDIVGLDGTYELTRAGLITDPSDWRYAAIDCDATGHCTCQDIGLDPGHAFRQWDAAITLAGTTYTAHVALPDDAATSIQPFLSAATEYFFTAGRFRIFLWDTAILTDFGPDWIPVDRWRITDHDGGTRYFGVKPTSYGGTCVLEVSNDPTGATAYPFGATGFNDTMIDLTSCVASPTAVTGAATSQHGSVAVLNGVVNANGAAVATWFEYGTEPCDLGTCEATSAQDVPGSDDTALAATVTDLVPGQLYHFRVVALNAGGLQAGGDATFSTPCTPQPLPGCDRPGSTSLTLRRSADPRAQKLTLSWSGSTAAPLDFGDPTRTTSYAACVYDQTGVPPVLGALVPAGRICGSKPCWRGAPAPSQFRYADHDAAPDGITGVRLKTVVGGTSKLKVSGRGAALPLPTLPLSAPVTVQLQASNGTCWNAVFTSGIRANDAFRFSARATTP